MTFTTPPSLIPGDAVSGPPTVWIPARVISGRAEQRAWTLYEDATGQFCAGIWECDEGHWAVEYTECEFVQMLSGRIRIIDAQSNGRVVGPGDSFIVPAGFRGSWEILEPARKYFAIFENKGAAREP